MRCFLRPAIDADLARGLTFFLGFLVATSHFAIESHAVDLAYSFETDLQGFGPNGLGVTVTSDTIGATEGTNSMKVSIVAPATFVGAATTQLEPFIGDPPGLDFLLFDLTLTSAFPTEGFVDAGVTVFGVTQPDFPGGQQPADAQFFANQVPLGDLAVGTHSIRMELSQAVHPVTFVTASFNEIFGTVGSGPNDIIPTGFQIYINKSSNAPWTGYIDNIRVGSNATGNGGDYNADGVVDAADYTVWRDNLGAGPAGDGTTTGDLLGVPDGVVDNFDYAYWVQQFGTSPGGGSPGVSGANATPEPSMLLIAALTLAIFPSLRFTARRPTA